MSECCTACSIQLTDDMILTPCEHCPCHTSQQEEGWRERLLKITAARYFTIPEIEELIEDLLKSHQEEAIAKIEGLRKVSSDDPEAMKYLLADELKKHGFDPLKDKDLQQIHDDAVRFARIGAHNEAIDQALSILKGEK